VVDTEQTVEKGVDRIETAASSAMDAIKQTTKQGQTGGLYIPNKQLNSKIQRGGKRLRKTMKMFSSTLPMLKFSCSNSRDTRKRKKQGGKSRKNLKTNVIRTNLRRNSRRKKRN
jgi:hypothetical protein